MEFLNGVRIYERKACFAEGKRGMDKEAVKRQIRDKKLMAILRGVDEEHVLPLVRALYEGGVRVVEIPFRPHDAAYEQKTAGMLSRLSELGLDDLAVGAGTVLHERQVRLSREAGAAFIVSPNVSERVIQAALEEDMVSIPGAMTPTEWERAYEKGADFVKVFPAAALGAEYIRLAGASLSHIPVLAVGGVTCDAAPAFLEAGAAGVGAGSELAPPAVYRAGGYRRVTQMAAAYVRAVSLCAGVRSKG